MTNLLVYAEPLTNKSCVLVLTTFIGNLKHFAFGPMYIQELFIWK